MIKSAFLNRKCRNLIKNKGSRDHSTYRDSSNIGILYNVSEYSERIVMDLIDNLTADGKGIAKLAYEEKESENRFSFCKKDVSIAGNLKKDAIGLFTKQRFDFLIALNNTVDVNFKYILALSKAHCKVGIHIEEYKEILEMTVKPTSDVSKNIKEVIRYLKMI